MPFQFSIFDDPPSLAPPRPTSTVDFHGPPARHTVFFAAMPDADDAARLAEEGAAVARRLGITGEALSATRLHVTLHAVGNGWHEPTDDDIDRWRRAAERALLAPFEAAFDQVSTFGDGGNPLVFKSSEAAGTAGFVSWHRQLGMALADVGERIHRPRITPHMTLCHRGRRVADTAVEPLRWPVRTLMLIDSHFGEHRHEVLGRWPACNG